MSGDTTQRAWAASEDLILCGQYHAGVAIARIEVPTRTNETCISRVKDLIKDGVLTPPTAARNRKAKPDPLTIWRRLCGPKPPQAQTPHLPSPAAAHSSASTPATAFLGRHNSETATPWGSRLRGRRREVR